MFFLQELAFKYGTDKRESRHNYVSVYEELFKKIQLDPIKLLEIGVYNCSSHNMWVDWFPNATIYGIDINDANFSKYNKARLQLDRVDQGDPEQLALYAELHGPWRIIIDDGSHLATHQVVSFNTLWPHIEPGGYYVVEDTHSAYWDHLVDKEPTIITHMQEVVSIFSDAPHYKGYYANPEVRKHNEAMNKYQKEVDFVMFRMGLIIVKKRDRVYV